MTADTIEKEIERSIAETEEIIKCASETEKAVETHRLIVLKAWLADRQSLKDELKEKSNLLEGANAGWAKADNKWIEQKSEIETLKGLPKEVIDEKKLAQIKKGIIEGLNKRIKSLEASTLTKDEAMGIIEAFVKKEGHEIARQDSYYESKDGKSLKEVKTEIPFIAFNKKAWDKFLIDLFAKKGVDLKQSCTKRRIIDRRKPDEINPDGTSKYIRGVDVSGRKTKWVNKNIDGLRMEVEVEDKPVDEVKG